MKQNILLPFSVLIASVVVSVAVLFTGSSRGVQENSAQIGPNLLRGESENKIQIEIGDSDPILGDAKAPVTIIAFEDFECPFCRRFSQQTLPLITEQYVKTGKVRVVWKDFPLSIHSHAQRAHEAARCAWAQEKFWEYHGMLFDNQSNLNDNSLKQYAKKLGLNEDQFSSCLSSGKYTSLIRDKISEGNTIGVTGTPSFLINGRLVVGAQPYQTFADIINQLAQ